MKPSNKKLQERIDKCIDNLLYARKYKDNRVLQNAYLDMESILVSTYQQFDCINDYLTETNYVIKTFVEKYFDSIKMEEWSFRSFELTRDSSVIINYVDEYEYCYKLKISVIELFNFNY